MLLKPDREGKGEEKSFNKFDRRQTRKPINRTAPEERQKKGTKKRKTKERGKPEEAAFLSLRMSGVKGKTQNGRDREEAERKEKEEDATSTERKTTNTPLPR